MILIGSIVGNNMNQHCPLLILPASCLGDVRGHPEVDSAVIIVRELIWIQATDDDETAATVDIIRRLIKARTKMLQYEICRFDGTSI